MLSTLLKFQDLLVKALAGVAALMVLLMLYMTVGDVVSRWLGFGSWVSSLPIVEFSLLYFAIFSAPYLVRLKAHVAVDSFIKFAPPAFQRVALLVVLVVSSLACLAFAIISVQMLEEAISTGEMVMGGIDLPFWLIAAPMPLGYLVVAIEFARMAIAGETIYGTESGGAI